MVRTASKLIAAAALMWAAVAVAQPYGPQPPPGTITGVTAGTGLSGGGSSGNISLALTGYPDLYSTFTLLGTEAVPSNADSGQPWILSYGHQGVTATPSIINGLLSDTATQVTGGTGSGSYTQAQVGGRILRIGVLFTLGVAGSGGSTTNGGAVNAAIWYGVTYPPGGGLAPPSPCHMTAAYNNITILALDNVGGFFTIGTLNVNIPEDGSLHKMECVLDPVNNVAYIVYDNSLVGGPYADSYIATYPGTYANFETFYQVVATDQKTGIAEVWASTSATDPSKPWMTGLNLANAFASPGIIGSVTPNNGYFKNLYSTNFFQATGTTPQFLYDQAGVTVTAETFGTAVTPAFAGQTARGTLASPTATLSGDILASFGGRGYTGAAFISGSQATWQAIAGENISGTNQGAKLCGLTTPNGSTISSRASRLCLDQNGWLSFGASQTPGAFADFNPTGVSLAAHDNAGALFRMRSTTITDTTSSGTDANVQAVSSFDGGVLAASSATTYSGGVATLYCNSAPTAGANVTISGTAYCGFMNGPFKATGLIVGTAGETIQGGTANINASSNNATNICTGTCNGTVTLGNTNSSIVESAPIKVANLLSSPTSPTISSGFGSGAAISTNNGTASFSVNVGTGGAASVGVIGMPAAANGWSCKFADITNPDTALTDQSGSSTTSISVKNYSRTTGLATAWAASDILEAHCFAN